MAYDNLTVVRIKLCDVNRALTYVAVAGSVEAVTANLVLLIVLVRDTVEVSFLRHRLMECGIEYGNFGNAGHKLHAGVDTDEVRRVVKRSKVAALFDALNNFVVDDNGGREFLAAVYDTMTYCTDLGEILNHAVLGICEGCKHVLDCYFVIRKRIFKNNLLAAGGGVLQTAVNADTLAKTYGQSLLGLGVDQLILQGTASAVDN